MAGCGNAYMAGLVPSTPGGSAPASAANMPPVVAPRCGLSKPNSFGRQPVVGRMLRTHTWLVILALSSFSRNRLYCTQKSARSVGCQRKVALSAVMSRPSMSSSMPERVLPLASVWP